MTSETNRNTGASIAALSAAGLGVSIWRLVVKRRERRAQRDVCAPPVAFTPGIRFSRGAHIRKASPRPNRGGALVGNEI